MCLGLMHVVCYTKGVPVVGTARGRNDVGNADLVYFQDVMCLGSHAFCYAKGGVVTAQEARTGEVTVVIAELVLISRRWLL